MASQGGTAELNPLLPLLPRHRWGGGGGGQNPTLIGSREAGASSETGTAQDVSQSTVMMKKHCVLILVAPVPAGDVAIGCWLPKLRSGRRQTSSFPPEAPCPPRNTPPLTGSSRLC